MAETQGLEAEDENSPGGMTASAIEQGLAHLGKGRLVIQGARAWGKWPGQPVKDCRALPTLTQTSTSSIQDSFLDQDNHLLTCLPVPHLSSPPQSTGSQKNPEKT